jgi:hypothetical protein
LPLVSQLSDLQQPLLEGEPIQFVQWQADQDREPALQLVVGPEEGLALVIVAAFHRRRIFDAPVRRHRLAGPDRAHFSGRLIAHREHEVQLLRAGRR